MFEFPASSKRKNRYLSCDLRTYAFEHDVSVGINMRSVLMNRETKLKPCPFVVCMNRMVFFSFWKSAFVVGLFPGAKRCTGAQMYDLNVE